MDKNITISKLKKDLDIIIENVLKDDSILNIRSKSGNVLMMPKEKYDSLIETLYLSQDANIKQSIIDGMSLSHEECLKEKIL